MKKVLSIFLASILVLSCVFTACNFGGKANETTYKITFDLQGGTGTAPVQTVNSGEKAAKPGDPTYAGYTFKGWSSTAATYTAFDFNKAITSDTTVYACWTAVEAPLTAEQVYKKAIAKMEAKDYLAITEKDEYDEGYYLSAFVFEKGAFAGGYYLETENDTILEEAWINTDKTYRKKLNAAAGKYEYFTQLTTERQKAIFDLVNLTNSIELMVFNFEALGSFTVAYSFGSTNNIILATYTDGEHTAILTYTIENELIKNVTLVNNDVNDHIISNFNYTYEKIDAYYPPTDTDLTENDTDAEQALRNAINAMLNKDYIITEALMDVMGMSVTEVIIYENGIPVLIYVNTEGFMEYWATPSIHMLYLQWGI